MLRLLLLSPLLQLGETFEIFLHILPIPGGNVVRMEQIEMFRGLKTVQMLPDLPAQRCDFIREFQRVSVRRNRRRRAPELSGADGASGEGGVAGIGEFQLFEREFRQLQLRLQVVVQQRSCRRVESLRMSGDVAELLREFLQGGEAFFQDEPGVAPLHAASDAAGVEVAASWICFASSASVSA